ncbi:MAG TPA: FAD-binding oxidoreductase [Rhizomicrobium sp.]|nr:FAD-binding oxidoreductase [Rhizomicrobium sp.]
MNADLIARLKQAAGPHGASEDPHEIAPHLEEWRSKYQGHSPLLLKPATTQQVAAILAICNEAKTPIVPQGGNTGLVGGQIPFNGEILLSLARLNRVRHVDAEANTVTVEAGVTLDGVHKAAASVNRLFPLSLASEGSCTIGGNLSTNAGGVNVLRYGNTRDLVLGVEAVLADGRVLDLTRGLRKDNTGYDLKQLFIGAEGTLGIVTAAVLKLFPVPTQRTTAFAAIPSARAALTLLARLNEASGGLISAFELMSRSGLDLVLAHIPQTRDPLAAKSDWYVLVEATGSGTFNLDETLRAALSEAMEAGEITDAAIAESDAQKNALWRLRESMSEAQKREGASIKHDISLPLARIPEFLDVAIAAVTNAVPGVRPVPFGHLGDGNLHFNFSAPKGEDEPFLARWSEINRIVHDIVNTFGGSISAEHGVGVMKRDEIVRYKSPIELDVMRDLKRTLDPNNILNPGKVVSI